MLLQLLIGKEIGRYKVTKVKFDEHTKQYTLGFKCNQCGEMRQTKLIGDKPSVLNCPTCNYRLYLIGYAKNPTDKEVIDFDIVSEAKYKRLRKEFKKANDTDFILYAKNYLRKAGN